ASEWWRASRRAVAPFRNSQRDDEQPVAKRSVADETQRLSTTGYGIRTWCVGAPGHKIIKARPCRRRLRLERCGQHLFLGRSQVRDGCNRSTASPTVQFRTSNGTATCHLSGDRELMPSIWEGETALLTTLGPV